MGNRTLPIVILAGSDRRAGQLPAQGADRHPLSGYKGVDVRIAGRPMVEILVERLRECGRFEPIFVVGPASRYARDLGGGVRLVESDGAVGDNLRAGFTAVRAARAGRFVAVTTCDVLPDRASLGALADAYERAGPCALWFPLVRVPEDRARLGVSEWKPTYRLRERPGEPAVAFLPGHIAITDPDGLREPFVYQLIQVGYQTRNRPIGERRGVMVRGVLRELVSRDLRSLLRLRPPTLTLGVLAAGIGAAGALKAGTITRRALERALERILISRRYRRANPGLGVRLPLVDVLSLALDIDTEEEARAAGGDVTAGEA